MLITGSVVNAQGNINLKPKLSPRTQQYLLEAKKYGAETILDGYIYKTGIDNAIYVSALIKAGTIQQSSLTSLGIHVGTKAGDIWTVQIPQDKVNAFTQLEGIEYIQIDEPVFADMDTTRVVTRVDSVHAGINLPMPYTGKDVVVGIIDAGFDYTNVTLFDTNGVNFRLKKVWEQRSGGTPPSQFFYGNEMATTNTLWTKKTDAFGFSHGAHVAGIAAGSGFGSDNTNSRFRGMAYESDIVFVGITPQPSSWTSTGLSDIIDAISYIFSYAAAVGKPAVANLSWGCSVGPHDGSSLFSQACDNLTGQKRIFVCSAGNNGAGQIHFQKSFTSSDTLANTILVFPDVQGQKRAWIDAWGDTAKTFCLKASLYTGGNLVTTTGFYCLDNMNHDLFLIGSSGDTCFVNMSTSAAEFNQKPRIFLDVYNKTNDLFVISLSGNDGTVDMWTGYVKNKTGYYGNFISSTSIVPSTAGNTAMTISDISSTRSAIAVAAYVSKNQYTDIQNNPHTYSNAVKGNIASFSSRGPTADGRTKPDIAAPGLGLGSSVSTFDSTFSQTTGSNYASVVTSYYKPLNMRTYQYAMLGGTSMSSPAAAGIIALMLQVKPTLDPADVKEILTNTAILDNYTGQITSAGSNTWGYGKINAYGAIQAILAELGIQKVAASGEQLACLLYPNPNKGLYNIDLSATENDIVKVEVYSVTGSNIIVKDWKVNKGDNTTSFNLENVKPGIYFTKLSSKKGSVTIKMTIQ